MQVLQGTAKADESGWQVMTTMEWEKLARIEFKTPGETLGSLLQADVPESEADGRKRLTQGPAVVLTPIELEEFNPEQGLVRCRRWRLVDGVEAVRAARLLATPGRWSWVLVRLGKAEADWPRVDRLLREVASLSRLFSSPGAAKIPLDQARAWMEAATSQGASARDVAAVVETWLPFHDGWEGALRGAKPDLGDGKSVAVVWRGRPKDWVLAIHKRNGKGVDLGF